jgi:hypothetical protein
MICSDVTVEGPEGLSGTFLVRLTNFRFLFQDSRTLRTQSSSDASKESLSFHKMVHWSHIASTSVGKSFLFWRTTSLTLHLYSPSQSSASSETVTLTLSNDQFDKFVQNVQLQQDRKSWLHYPMEYLLMTGKETAESVQIASSSKKTNTAPRSTSTAMVGISGLTRHMEEKHKEVGNSLQEAFKDMDSLFEKAREMVAIATRLSSTARSQTSEEQSHFQSDINMMMGIRSPVTLGAHDSHDLYLEELSREVDTFVCGNFQLIRARNKQLQSPQNPLLTNVPSVLSGAPSSISGPRNDIQIVAEVIPLIDLYCIFNRARGTALVSPTDLLGACKRLAPLRLRCRLIELNDGVLAVASDQYDEESIAKQVSQILSSVGPLSASQLASQQQIGLPLATHYLLRAESMELACRDHSSEGLIFWPNIFSVSY